MDSPAERAADRLAWEMGSWRAIELRTHSDYLVNHVMEDSQQAVTETSSHYIETAGGPRMFEEKGRLGSGEERRTVFFFDGERAAHLSRVNLGGRSFDSVQIKRGFGRELNVGWRSCPDPLWSFYAGVRPLYEVLPKAQYLGESRHLERDCDVFLVSRASGLLHLDAVYVLDRATGVPLKLTLYNDAQQRAENWPGVEWVAESLDEIEGRHLPFRSILNSGSPKPALSLRIVVDAVHFDRDYPSSTFWPKIDETTQVIDTLAHKIRPSQLMTRPAGSETGTGDSQAIQATPRGTWSDALPLVSLGLGLLVLAAGAILWWRRR